jgi:hypothetical protein
MASRQSDSANRTLVYSIMCINVTYTVLHYCFGEFLGYMYVYIYTHTHTIRKYRTIGIIGLPTLPISPFIRGSTVLS